MSRLLVLTVLALAIGVGAGCNEIPAAERRLSYAVYAEYAKDSNKLMQPDLNRRVFNRVEAQVGSDIELNPDGTITLTPGTYHLTGVSTVTMQTTFAPPEIKNNDNYPGYAIVYPLSAEKSGMQLLKQAIAIGTPSTASDLAPSVFDTIHVVTSKTEIAVGHQAGHDLHNEVYLSVYEVNGEKSDYHAVARISIVRIDR